MELITKGVFQHLVLPRSERCRNLAAVGQITDHGPPLIYFRKDSARVTCSPLQARNEENEGHPLIDVKATSLVAGFIHHATSRAQRCCGIIRPPLKFPAPL